VEKANGHLKCVILREWLANPDREFQASVRRAVMLHNRTPKSHGYSPYFLSLWNRTSLETRALRCLQTRTYRARGG